MKATRPAILQQLDVVTRDPVRPPGQAEEGDSQLRVGIAYDGAEVRLAAVPLGDQLETQEIAVEDDRALQIAHGEPGVQDPGDGHDVLPRWTASGDRVGRQSRPVGAG
jgi:hypothetical protein